MKCLILLPLVLAIRINYGSAGCMEPKEPGTPCPGGVSETRWYYNKDKFKCLAFTYTGCGGNENNYRTLDECLRCRVADGPTCHGAGFSQGPPRPPGSGPHACQEAGCPEGYVCKRGAMMSDCCNKAVEDQFDAIFSPTCLNGAPVLKSNPDEVFLGDSCSDMTCPGTYGCEQINQYFARCCTRMT